ncbi:hypothetical protein PN462_07940 [Spirulina sp. CS-785/01]|uniref:hypothetical protein n=1 Tax=Spirulina sp. CS-785/01 TaxID=3021716 RepID=UPI00232DBC2D|nr:hypothetical protein [Spirulina sp. CS-785/01]MDB9313029.1 hypothetical protein [Spirulina sp. CS-785/01]
MKPKSESAKRYDGLLRSVLEKKTMALKKSVYIVPLILIVVFIVAGDKFLPEPMSGASTRTRNSIVKFVTGIFTPDKKLNPTQDKLDRLEDMEEEQTN